MSENIFQTIKLDELQVSWINHRSVSIEDMIEEREGITQLKRNDENPNPYVNDITVVMEIATGFVIPSVLHYLIERSIAGIEDTSSEARGLRLYFEFLFQNELVWDEGDSMPLNRPLERFSSWLTSLYYDGDIAGTTALAYFHSVCKFYKYYLSKNYPFRKSVPVEFNRKVIQKYNKDLTSHITGLEIVIESAKCRPKISSSAKSTELLPFTPQEKKEFFDKLQKGGSIEFYLICLLSLVTGLRASEIADLRVDMLKGYNSQNLFTLALGPKAGHKTKHKSNQPIQVHGDIIDILQAYNKTHRYIKRLDKFNGKRANIFLNQSGDPFTQHSISTAFNKFLHCHIYTTNDSFNHKFHDIRVTFGVDVLRAALDSGMSPKRAVSHTKTQMRHKYLEETLKYLEHFDKDDVLEKQAEVNEGLLNEAFEEIGSING